jgi:hypothetical protein
LLKQISKRNQPHDDVITLSFEQGDTRRDARHDTTATGIRTTGTGRFESAELERAYTLFLARLFGTRLRVSFLCFLLLASALLCAGWVAARDSCARCADRVFVLAAALAMAATFAFFCLHMLAGATVRLSRGALFLAHTAVFASAVLVQSLHCPTLEPVTWHRHAALPDLELPALLQLVSSWLLSQFSGLAWPTNAILATVCGVVQAVAMLSVAWSGKRVVSGLGQGWVWVVVLYVCGTAVVIVQALLTNIERHREFAMGAVLR